MKIPNRMTTTKNITICACSSRSFMPSVELAKLTVALRESGYNVTLHHDLCEAAQSKSAELQDISIVVGCYERAMHSIFTAGGAEKPRVLELRGRTAYQVLQDLGITYEEYDQSKVNAVLEQIKTFPVKVATDAWFPVIDRDKCIDCGKCHDFCLFGVYTIVDGHVEATSPQNCKNNCPACARVCPVEAVIFPKYEKAPINGGTMAEDGAIKLDMESMYADALRSRLAQRRASVMLFKDKK